MRHFLGLLGKLIILAIICLVYSDKGKFFYDIDLEYQNTVGNENVTIPLPTFSSIPPYFVIGGVFSLTYSDGNVNPEGFQHLLATRCAVNDINTKFGPARNLPTEWFYQVFNDHTTPAIAVRAAVQIVEAGIPVTLGPILADSALAAAALYSAFNITKVSGGVTADQLSNTTLYGSFYRTIPPDRYAATVIVNTFLYFNWTLVTPIYTDNVYGESGRLAYSSAATNSGILSTCGRVIPPGGINGLYDTINCLTTSQSTVVLLWMEADDAANCISTFYSSGLVPDLTFIATASWGDIFDVETWSQGRFPASYLEGSLSIIPAPGNQTVFKDCVSSFALNETDTPHFNEFVENSLRCVLPGSDGSEDLPVCPSEFHHRGAFPNLNCTCMESDTLGSVPPLYLVNYVYDAVLVLFNALDQISNNCTGLSEATGIDFCSDQGNISSTDLIEVIKFTHFEGLTGLVAFDGNDPVTINYDILQRRSDGDLITVGYENKTGNVTIDNSLLKWKNGELPVSQIVPQEITISQALGWIALIFIIIALLIAIIFVIYFYVNRKEKVIKKTSPFFSQLMLLGIILCIVSQIFWDISQSTATCILKVWCLAIGFGLIMGNLLAKTYRIFKIFNNARVTSLVIRDVDLLKFTVAIFILEIVLLCLYTFSSGVPTPVAIQSQSDNLLKIIQCQVPSKFVQTAGIIVLFAVNFILVLAAVIVAFLTRNVDSNFNESIYIGYVVYIYLLVAVILLPLYYTAGDSRSSFSRQFIIRTIGVLVPMYFTLGALFGPKIYLVYKTRKAEKRMAEANRERDTGKRVVDFGTSTGGGPSTAGAYGGEYSTGGGTGPYAKALRGVTATTTTNTSSDDEHVLMPGGPRARSGISGSSTSGTGTVTSRPSAGNEFDSLIHSTTKKNK